MLHMHMHICYRDGMDGEVELVVWRLGEAGSVARQLAAYREVLRGDPCSYCGGRGGVADHIQARAVRGEDAWGNLTAACRRCNMRKGSRSLLAMLLGLPVGMDHREQDRLRVARHLEVSA